ncbi:GDSL esterase/lipase [Actinidia chinensis var. chinensis]|uniref:GDSL esterase/lipase n=1 Tax=Actinidia chinensis var. chinensis TaxID=1590841 RepID=A0A2R6PY02_ACTCC|nr:GDSL esterase/lipase [Actinidia chinensis var. chinensis]
MASRSPFLGRKPFTYTYLYLYLCILIPTFSVSTKQALGCYTSIFSFGDSLADTGNCLHISQRSSVKPPNFGLPPYGETYFRRPTGRCSDGRLIIDFIAQYLGLPLVPPYFSGQNKSGVNFAVVGATALDDEFFEERGIHNNFKNVTLGDQLGWFKEMLSPLSHNTPPNCKKLLQNSLILVGGIGHNDYSYVLKSGRSIEEMQLLVPLVINVIALAIKELIELGAVTLIVPGNLPSGCSPSLLTRFASSIKADYDPETGCLARLNEFSKYHNQMLQKELDRIRELYPHATIIYADYYNAAIRFYKSPIKFGFRGRALSACCGVGGPYNFNSSAQCGSSLSRACDDPSSYISWDGIHLTEAAYKWISKGLLEGPYTIPPIKTSCISLTDFPMGR